MKYVWNRKLIPCTAGLILILTAVLSCTSQPKADKSNVFGDLPPQHLGTLHLNIVKRYTNQLIPRRLSFVFEPSTNTIRFHHKFIGDNIWIYLEQENRAALRQAVETYLADYKAKKLLPENSKKRGYFGTTDVTMTWGILGSAHSAAPELRFEYQSITPQRPYFILSSSSASSEDGASSPVIRIAVSPAQCKELLSVLDDTTLLELTKNIQHEYEKFDDSEETNPIDSIEKTAEETGEPAADQPFDEF